MDGVMAARYPRVTAWPDAGSKQQQQPFSSYASSTSQNTASKPLTLFEPPAAGANANNNPNKFSGSKPTPGDLVIQQSLARVQRQLADLTAATQKQLQLSPATSGFQGGTSNGFYSPPQAAPVAAAAPPPIVIPTVGPGVRPKPGETVQLPGRQALANVPPKRTHDFPPRSRYMADLSPASRYPPLYPDILPHQQQHTQGQGQRQGSDVIKKQQQQQQQQQQGSKVSQQQPSFAITNTAAYRSSGQGAAGATSGTSASNGVTGSQERSQALVRMPTHIAGSSGPGGPNDEEHYMRLINDIVSVLSPLEYYGSSPAKLLDYLFIGGYRDAEDVAKLRRMGITHVFNCAPLRSRGAVQSPYPPSCGIVAYDQVYAEDEESYDILQHFDKARQFIDRAKFGRGRCLVHCAMGVNRSGAICAAYVIADQRMKLLDVVRLMKQRRGIVLCNRGFQRLLIRFARQRGLL